MASADAVPANGQAGEERPMSRLECRLALAQQLSQNDARAPLATEDVDYVSLFPASMFQPLTEAKHLSVVSIAYEVLSRGGHAQVSSERKWSEVVAALKCNGFQGANQAVRTFYESIAFIERDEAFVNAILNVDAQYSGAVAAALPPEALTALELHAFGIDPSGIAAHQRERYLDARNHILQIWCWKPSRAIDFQCDVMDPLLAKFTPAALSMFHLDRAFFLLSTMGFLNWGSCLPEQVIGADGKRPKVEQEQDFVPNGVTSKRIIVVGGGFAGLTCALQLRKFGHQVVLVEARKRLGGRVFTDTTTFSHPVDLGAMLVTGVEGHPASVLIDQLAQPTHIVDEACPLFLSGDTVDPDLDAMIETKFNSMLNEASSDERARWRTSNVAAKGPGRPGYRRKGRRVTGRRASASTQESIRSKYGGVYWSAERNGFEVALIRKSSGSLERLPEVFQSEVLAAQYHDDELLKRDRSQYWDSLNSEIYPHEFSRQATSDNFVSASIATAAISSFEEHRGRYGRDLTLLQSTIPMRNVSQEDDLNVLAQQVTGGWNGIDWGRAAVANADRIAEKIQQARTFLAKGVSGDSSDESVYDKPSNEDREDSSLMERLIESKPYINGWRHDSKDSRSLENSILNWHVSNLEYACSSNLWDVSAAHWDQDDEHDWEGSHVLLPKGFSCLTEALGSQLVSQGAELMLGKVVERIQVLIDHVRIATANLVEDPAVPNAKEWIEGDAVVITVPLGVLKTNAIEFHPPLPEWKQQAIHRMGYGNLNKVVLEFDHVFWDEKLDIFGRVISPAHGPRGECYMFWCLNRQHEGSNLILALIAGDAADQAELRTDDEVASRAVAALREAIGGEKANQAKLKSSIVTRWRSDPFARGSYSYVAVGATGDDYDLLAEPCLEGRVFFAGEATCREHPATTGGAILSGLREAARIACRFGRLVPSNSIANDSAGQILARVDGFIALEPLEMSRSQAQTTQSLIDRVQNGNFQTSSLKFSRAALEVETFTPFGIPASNRTPDRQASMQAASISSRLPKDWQKDQVAWYLNSRLGGTTSEDDPPELGRAESEPAKVTCWV